MPTIALAIPLSGSPTGLGLLTRKPRFSSLTPVTAMYPRMMSNAPMTKAAKSPVTVVMVRLSTLRRQRLRMYGLPLAARCPPNQQPCHRVYYEGDDEQ